MKQLELPFKGGKPPSWFCCESCKHVKPGGCNYSVGDCLYKKSKYTEQGGVFFKYYNFFELKGE